MVSFGVLDPGIIAMLWSLAFGKAIFAAPIREASIFLVEGAAFNLAILGNLPEIGVMASVGIKRGEFGDINFLAMIASILSVMRVLVTIAIQYSMRGQLARSGGTAHLVEAHHEKIRVQKFYQALQAKGARHATVQAATKRGEKLPDLDDSDDDIMKKPMFNS